MYVNHIYDRPGYFTCERVPSNDRCLTDQVCELENKCPGANGRRTGIYEHDMLFNVLILDMQFRVANLNWAYLNS